MLGYLYFLHIYIYRERENNILSIKTYFIIHFIFPLYKGKCVLVAVTDFMVKIKPTFKLVHQRNIQIK